MFPTLYCGAKSELDIKYSFIKRPLGKNCFLLSAVISVSVDTRAFIARLLCLTQYCAREVLRHFLKAVYK